MTEVSVIKLGRRWFSVMAADEGKTIADVEASYSNNGGAWNPKLRKFSEPHRDWTLTGKGARKYRQQIIDHLEGKYFDGDSETN